MNSATSPRLSGLLAVLALVYCAWAAGQAYPTRPIHIVLPVSGGGIQDNLTRAMAPEMTRRLGQPVIVDNRGGANGILASEYVVHSAPDGYTILMTSYIQVSNDLVPGGTKLTFDPVTDLMPVIGLVSTGNVLVTTPEFPANNLQELIALARQKPGQLNYGSWGISSSPHIDTEMISRLTGVKMTHVPYKGGGPLLQAVLAKEVDFSLMALQTGLPYVRQGKLKALAFGGLQRSSVLPEVPTISESGFKNFDSGGWFGWLVPAATPKPVVERIAADASAVIANPAFRDRHILQLGMEVLNLSSAAFAERFKIDRQAYAARLKNLGAAPL
jgi:tripartite-type tricarboxylate transporter receptor subunit TctC